MQKSRLCQGLSALIRLLVILCALLPMIGGYREGRALAQEPGLLYGLRTEILFPSVVRFMGGVNESSTRIDTISIRVRQGAQLDETFTFVPAEHILADYGSSVELVYDWPLAGETIPTPFESVEVVWSVRLTDGQTAEATDSFVFEDRAAGTWETANDGPVVLHWFNTSLAGYTLQADILRAYALLSEHVPRVPPLEAAIYDPTTELCKTVEQPDGSVRLVVVSAQDGRQYPCSVQAYRSLYESKGIMFFQRKQYGYVPLQNALVTALVRQAAAPLWRGKAVPAWFEVGLAGLYHLQPDTPALQVARAAGRTESLIPLEGLMFDPPDDWPEMKRQLWEAQSYLMVLYLADGWGADAPFQLAERLTNDTGDFETIFASITGQNVRLFWVEWQRWLFAGAAEDATRWTPYLETTPTPTPTATATVIVPTATFTVVPSYTPSREFAGTVEATSGPGELVTPTPR